MKYMVKKSRDIYTASFYLSESICNTNNLDYNIMNRIMLRNAQKLRKQ